MTSCSTSGLVAETSGATRALQDAVSGPTGRWSVAASASGSGRQGALERKPSALPTLGERTPVGWLRIAARRSARALNIDGSFPSR